MAAYPSAYSAIPRASSRELEEVSRRHSAQLLTPFTKGKRLQLVEAPRSIEIFRPWGSFVLSIFAPHGTRPFCALGHRAHWPMTSRSVHDKQL